MNKNTLIEIEDLHIDIIADEGMLTAVRGVNLDINRGETLGLVGESGCGKSLTSKAVLGINAKNCRTSGRIMFRSSANPGGEPVDLLSLRQNGPEIRAIRGKHISMIFQEPMAAFSPMYTIGNQINECTRLHITKDKEESKSVTIDMMKKVGIANAEKRYDQYPHEFSGGMLQRALIAMALVCKPDLLIADEPTTALDVTIQAQILELMKTLQKETGTSILFITHDLGTVAKICDRVAVMYLGKIVETASVRDIFKNPEHPYTTGLIGSVHRLGTSKSERLVSIEGTVPLAMNLPAGCSFYDRCKKHIEGTCNVKDPEPVVPGEKHSTSCWLYGGK